MLRLNHLAAAVLLFVLSVVWLALGGRTFRNDTPLMSASVHDPSIIKVDDIITFWLTVLGTKSTDLRNWTQIETRVHDGNRLIPNVYSELAETFEWAKQIRFGLLMLFSFDGRFYMYYCACRGDSPLSALGVAVSDHIEGPYKNLGSFSVREVCVLPMEASTTPIGIQM